MPLFKYSNWAINTNNVLLSNAQVRVKIADSVTLATIYSDAAGTSPIDQGTYVSDGEGKFEFYADPGEYDVEAGAGATMAVTRANILGDGGVSTKQTSPLDVGVGRLLTPGAFGLGVESLQAAPFMLSDVDDTTLVRGSYTVINTTTGDKPSNYGTLEVFPYVSGAAPTGVPQITQLFWSTTQEPDMYIRHYRGGFGWSAWERIGLNGDFGIGGPGPTNTAQGWTDFDDITVGGILLIRPGAVGQANWRKRLVFRVVKHDLIRPYGVCLSGAGGSSNSWPQCRQEAAQGACEVAGE